MPSVSSATSDPVGRRELNKVRTRTAIERAGWALLEAHGFDGVTVDEIADAADVSARTFFRYFESKEAVIFGDWRGDLHRWVAHVAGRPDGEPPTRALAQGSKAFFAACEHEGPAAARRYTIDGASRHIARFHASVVQPAWIDGLAGAIAARMSVTASDHVAPRTLATAAVGAANAATDVWLARGGSGSLALLVGDALDVIFADGDRSIPRDRSDTERRSTP